MPYSKSAINIYKNQIFIKENDNAVTNTHILETPFPGYKRHRIVLKSRTSDDEIFKFIKPFLRPTQNTQNCFNFNDESIKHKIIRIFQRFLDSNNSMSCIISNKVLEDVPQEDKQNQIIKYMHEGKTIHRGTKVTTNLIMRRYYWPNINYQVSRYIKNCHTCNTCKYDRHPQKIKFQNTPVPRKPLDVIHIDLFHFSNECYLTVFDPFSKIGQSYPLKSKTGIEVQQSLLTFIQHYGKPYKIICDKGKEFNNTMIIDYCDLHKISLHFTSTDSHTSNSPVERFHSSLIDSMRCLISENPNFPNQYLMKLATIGYNESIHSLTNHTPFEVLFGHLDKPSPFEISDEIITSDYIQEHKDLTQNLYEQLKINQTRNKENIISKINERRKELNVYNANDTVYIRNSQATRAKNLPKFISAKVIKDDGPVVSTNRGRFTKNQIRNNTIKQTQYVDSDDEPLFQVRQRLIKEKTDKHVTTPVTTTTTTPDLEDTLLKN